MARPNSNLALPDLELKRGVGWLWKTRANSSSGTGANSGYKPSGVRKQNGDKADKGARPKVQADKPMDNCIICKNHVVDDDKAIECQWCQGWEHKECLKMSDSQYKQVEEAPLNFMWFCTQCQPKVGMTLRFFNEVRETQNNIIARVEELEERVDTNEAHIEKIDSKVEKMDGFIKTTVEEIVKEDRDKEKRSLNLILHNVKESNAEIIEDRKAHDIRVVTDLFENHMKVEEPGIQEALRLGKKVMRNQGY
eukprot:gene1387-1525_t